MDPKSLTSGQRLLGLFDWLPEINRLSLRADLIAALTGAVLVIPQGVAFAAIAGMPPQYGLYTAMMCQLQFRRALTYE